MSDHRVYLICMMCACLTNPEQDEPYGFLGFINLMKNKIN